MSNVSQFTVLVAMSAVVGLIIACLAFTAYGKC